MPITEVSAQERKTFPFTAIGLIFATFPDGQIYKGTASVIGKNDNLTAGHNIFRPANGGLATEINFWFGADYNSVTGQFDFADAVTLWRPKFGVYMFPNQLYSDFDDSTNIPFESQYDIALIGVDSPIGERTGWLGLNPNIYDSNVYRQVGYPSDSTGMVTSLVPVTKDPIYSLFNSIQDLMTVGSSGGPLLTEDGYLIAVKVSGTFTSQTWAAIRPLYTELLQYYEENDQLLIQTQTKGPTDAARVFVFKSSKKGEGINPASEAYYYTSSEEEAEFILSQEKWPWIEQESTFEAAHSNPDEFIPVHKFWSDKHQSHYFTISEAEKDQIIDWSETDKNGYDWKYEGTGFNVYGSAAPTDSDGNSAIPVYKAWIDDKDFDPSNGVSGGHYFTADIEDYNTKIEVVGVKGEGVAFYGELLG